MEVPEYKNPVVDFNNTLLQMKKQKENFSNDLSTIDKAISDLYKGYLYAIRMKRLHNTRRELKEQHEQIKTLDKTINLKNTINNMDRAMLKVGKEMPRKKEQRIRTNDLLNCGNIELQNGWRV